MEWVWAILLWALWVVCTGIGLIFAVFVMAFGGDSPSGNTATRRAISPAFCYTIGAVIGGVMLMVMYTWWSIVLACLLGLSPPFAFIGLITLFHPRKSSA
jgi:hypothetical protein